MRINKYLANQGIASRRHADEMIKDGKVTVNGITALLGTDVNEGDEICVNGVPVDSSEQKKCYFMLHKPKGVVCTVSDDRGRKTVMDYLPQGTKRVFPVGRLDYDTEGLIILTNDGELSFRLTHPNTEIPKTYLVRVEGRVTEKDLNPIRSGIELDGKLTKKCKAHVVETNKDFTKIHITITEGRNREVRRMFDAIGKNIDFLRRIKLGELSLGGLGRGEVRELSEEEVYYLKNL